MDGKLSFVTKDGDVLKVPVTPAGKKDLATAMGLLLDKIRLEVGEATGRTETFGQDEFRRLHTRST